MLAPAEQWSTHSLACLTLNSKQHLCTDKMTMGACKINMLQRATVTGIQAHCEHIPTFSNWPKLPTVVCCTVCCILPSTRKDKALRSRRFDTAHKVCIRTPYVMSLLTLVCMVTSAVLYAQATLQLVYTKQPQHPGHGWFTQLTAAPPCLISVKYWNSQVHWQGVHAHATHIPCVHPPEPWYMRHGCALAAISACRADILALLRAGNS